MAVEATNAPTATTCVNIKRRLVPNVLRIERPRLVDVVGPLDNRTAVREYRELMPLGIELEHEAIEAHLAPHQLQMARHLLEVELRCDAVGDLHRIAAAEAGRLRTLFAF